MSLDDKLRVPLEARTDKHGRTFYLGRIKFPGDIDCREGVAFLVFTSDAGTEEIQIGEVGKSNRQKKSDEDDSFGMDR